MAKEDKAFPISWIKDSQFFFKNVIEDTINALRDNTTLSKSDNQALVDIRKNWIKKYQPEQKMPRTKTQSDLKKYLADQRRKSQAQQPRTIALLPDLPTKQKKYINVRKPSRKTNRRMNSAINKRNSLEEEQNCVVDIEMVDDNIMIDLAIAVTPFFSHWNLREYNVLVPARTIKRNEIPPILSIDLLDQLNAEPDLREANKLFQQHIDEKLDLRI